MAHILEEMGIKSIRLMTNNPRKITEMAALGIPVSGRIPCLVRWGASWAAGRVGCGIGGPEARALGWVQV